MNYDEQRQMNQEILIHVLGRIFGTAIVRADTSKEQLHGGTLGDVRLVSGMAESADGEKMQYHLVWKTQKKWERPGDTDSWRREYDLYMSNLGEAFSDSLRWPECYYTIMNDDENEIQIWMEYLSGVSGTHLTIDMLELAAFELGRFQGKYYTAPGDLREIGCLGDFGFMEREFKQWHTQNFTYNFLISESCRIPDFLKQMLKEGSIQLIAGKSFEYSCLRSRGCDIPEHLKQMLIEIDDRKDEIFNELKKLPVVLCHRDFWIENIFSQDDKIRLIDWDTSGWGYIGEDIASLIIDDTIPSNVEEYYSKLVPSYCKGLSEYMDISKIDNFYIREMILIKFGYRILQNYMFSEVSEVKDEQVSRLQKIYEML